jgi:hypothetical protein
MSVSSSSQRRLVRVFSTAAASPALTTFPVLATSVPERAREATDWFMMRRITMLAKSRIVAITIAAIMGFASPVAAHAPAHRTHLRERGIFALARSPLDANDPLVTGGGSIGYNTTNKIF